MNRNDQVSKLSFGLYDPQQEKSESERNLPHRFQPGVAAFITFRTADSLPRSVIELWDEEIRNWLERNSIAAPPNLRNLNPDSLPPSVRKPFLKYRDKRWHWHLDQCHGECLLRRPELAQIVADSLLHFEGDRYDLDRFVVMPNHVHLLAQFRLPTTLRLQCKSWLHFTACEINKKIGRSGTFWQSEPFDHLVRNGDQFAYLQDYIAQNPMKAHLQPGEFLFWHR